MLKSFFYSKGPTSFTIKSEVSELYLEAPTSDNFPHLAVSAVHYTVLQWLTVRLKADIFIIATTQHLSSLLSSFTLLYPNVKLHNDNYCQSTKTQSTVTRLSLLYSCLGPDTQICLKLTHQKLAEILISSSCLLLKYFFAKFLVSHDCCRY